MKGQKIAVWFSCGAASAVAAKKTVELYGQDNEIRIVNSGVKQEDSDNYRFLKDVEKWIGIEIEQAINPKYPTGDVTAVFKDYKYMSGRKFAPCTKEVKKNPRYLWEEIHKPDWHVLGFTSEETTRHKRFIITEVPNVIPVLIDAGLTKGDCFRIIQDAGIELPNIYKLGYPNANCIGCVKATSPTYWNHVRKVHPEVFKERADQSREIGCKLTRYKGKRLFLDELPADAVGRPMKDMNFECGVFCEVTN